MPKQQRQHQDEPGCWSNLNIAVGVTLLVVLLLLVAWTVGLGVFLSGFWKPRASTPSSPPVRGAAAAGSSSSTALRIRIANLNMLPIAARVKSQAAKAVQAGLFQGTDIVLVQEAWRPLALGRACDPAQVLAAAGGVTAAVVEQRSPAGLATDSGLAAFSTAPDRWPVKCVAFSPFVTASRSSVDALAHKGVAVFETAGGLRLATLHLQASYVRGRNRVSARILRRDAQVRLAQFAQAVGFAVRVGAVLLAGDVNTHAPAALAAMDAVVAAATGGTGRRLRNDGATTHAAVGTPQAKWRAAAADDTRYGVHIDHVWLLSTRVQVLPRGGGAAATTTSLPPPEVQTHVVATDGWTDHATLDLTLLLVP